MNQKKIIEILRTLAISSSGVNSSSHSSAIVRRGEIISFGVNQRKSHPFQKRFSRNENCIFFHAEVHSIFNALKKISPDELRKCELYVIRVLKNGKMTQSCPCIGCISAINCFNIGNVFYSDSNGVIQCL